MTDPDMYAVEVQDGRMQPVPDYVEVIQSAKWWGITPMDYLDMPVYWATAGAIVRNAEYAAQRKANRK